MKKDKIFESIKDNYSKNALIIYVKSKKFSIIIVNKSISYYMCKNN